MAKGNIFIYDLITRFGAIIVISVHNWNIIDVDVFELFKPAYCTVRKESSSNAKASARFFLYS